MNLEQFKKEISTENEYRQAGLKAVFQAFGEDDKFIEWLLKTKAVFTSEIDAIARFLSAHTENRMLELKDDFIEVTNSKYDYHIKIEDDVVVLDKFHANIPDNSTAHMLSIETRKPSELLDALVE